MDKIKNLFFYIELIVYNRKDIIQYNFRFFAKGSRKYQYLVLFIFSNISSLSIYIKFVYIKFEETKYDNKECLSSLEIQKIMRQKHAGK